MLTLSHKFQELRFSVYLTDITSELLSHSLIWAIADCESEKTCSVLLGGVTKIEHRMAMPSGKVELAGSIERAAKKELDSSQYMAIPCVFVSLEKEPSVYMEID